MTLPTLAGMTTTTIKHMLNIIIPVFNESQILRAYQSYYFHLKTKARVIFVDGGSTDQTREIAAQYGEVVISELGRDKQKNAGAAVADSEHLLFLHVDAFVSDETLQAVELAFKRGVQAGCFRMKIKDNRKIFRIYECIVNARAKWFGVIDGDLGMYIKRSLFEEMGGFDPLPVMEDIVFSRKLKKYVHIDALPANIQVSSRKWDEKGFLLTFACYTLAYIQLWTGIPFYKDKSQKAYYENSPYRLCPRTENR